MADRYQDRPFPADDDYDRGGEPHAPARAESDPLAELARLIGQTDPFAMGRANQPAQPLQRARANTSRRHLPTTTSRAAGPPPWMRRATPQAAPAAPQEDDYEQDYPSAVHPLHRYAAPHAGAGAGLSPAPRPTPTPASEPDPSRYDDALYGQLESGAQRPSARSGLSGRSLRLSGRLWRGRRARPKKRGGGMMTVAVVLALAVVGTGAAFAYRTFVGSPRSGEPPIIKADNSPTKIVPAPVGRLGQGAGPHGDRRWQAKRSCPREEDAGRRQCQVRSARGVSAAESEWQSAVGRERLAAGAVPRGAAMARCRADEPRRIKTLAVKGDQPTAPRRPVRRSRRRQARAPPHDAPRHPPAPAAPATRNPPLIGQCQRQCAAVADAAARGQAAPLPSRATRVAATNSVPAASHRPAGDIWFRSPRRRTRPTRRPRSGPCRASIPTVLGSRSPVIKRADLGDKGVYYRAMVGPFGSADEATQFCGNLKTAGGQCVVQRN